jgi:hypothetical protein
MCCTVASLVEAGSSTTTSPLLVNPAMTSRCPAVDLNRKPGSWLEEKAIEATTGIPALMNCSTSYSECSWVTSPSSP